MLKHKLKIEKIFFINLFILFYYLVFKNFDYNYIEYFIFFFLNFHIYIYVGNHLLVCMVYSQWSSIRNYGHNICSQWSNFCDDSLMCSLIYINKILFNFYYNDVIF